MNESARIQMTGTWKNLAIVRLDYQRCEFLFLMVKIMTRSRSPQPGTTDLRTVQRRQLQQAEDARVQRLVRTVNQDRTAVRPPLCILAVQPKREPVVLRCGYPFAAAGPAGSVDLLTVRDECVPAVRLEGAERIVQSRLVPERGEVFGVRLSVSNPSAAALSHLRFFVQDLDTLAWLLTHAEIVVRPADGDVRSAKMLASGIERADDLYPTPALGCRGRSLWAAYFHAPSALAFLDISFAEIAAKSLDVFALFRNPLDAERIEPSKFQLGCVPAVNQRTLKFNVTVEPTHTFEPIPVVSGQTTAGIGKVRAFRSNGVWADCRPWLGTRYPWKHRSLCRSPWPTGPG